MEKKINVSTVSNSFLLLGFQTSRPVQFVLFFSFLFAYILTVVENILVIVIVWWSAKLHKPMYFFLGHMSFLEMCYITVTVPKLLATFLTESKQISISACMTQLYFFISLICTECVLLAAMAFDRYVAICNPVHYIMIMKWNICCVLAFGSWFTGFLISLIKVYYIASLTFCYSGQINHFYCDISPILNLACTDVREAELVDFVLALFILLVPFMLIFISYTCILITILRLPTTTQRHKAFSTCGSHLAVIIIFYAATLFMYARPSKAQSLSYNKLISIAYTIITPLLNPIIYSLRNKEVKEAMWKIFSKHNSTF